MVFSGIRVAKDALTQSFPTIEEVRELYRRHVVAVSATIFEDDETLVNEAIGHSHGYSNQGQGFAINGHPGRGGNWHRMGRQRGL